MPKTLYTSVPPEYSSCIHQNCKLADTCLRRVAYSEQVKELKQFSIVNPEKATQDSTCIYYRSNKPIRYARGFTNFQQRMFPNQYERFMMTLCCHFGRNAYYARRRGDYAMPPAEQEVVLGMLKKVGVTEQLEFDSYEDAFSWD